LPQLLRLIRLIICMPVFVHQTAHRSGSPADPV
jgi:hypothetical protein